VLSSIASFLTNGIGHSFEIARHPQIRDSLLAHPPTCSTLNPRPLCHGRPRSATDRDPHSPPKPLSPSSKLWTREMLAPGRSWCASEPSLQSQHGWPTSLPLRMLKAVVISRLFPSLFHSTRVLLDPSSKRCCRFFCLFYGIKYIIFLMIYK
jgi:hypothetical protein